MLVEMPVMNKPTNERGAKGIAVSVC